MPVLHLVRHGQSQWNADGLLQGQTMPVPLTERGQREAEAAAQELAGLPISAVYSSDLVRAVQTATPIARLHGIGIRLDPDLRERGYGELEGMPSSAAYAATAGLDWTDADLRVGGGESTRDVHRRVGAALARCVAEHATPAGQQVVLVSHGDTIRVALGWCAGFGADKIPWREVPNGSITSIRMA